MSNSRNHSSLILIPEDKFVIFKIDPNEEYQQYLASPLLTCFAYLIYYQTQQDNTKAVLYHAKSGEPKRLPAIVANIESEYKSLNKIIIAIPHSENYANTSSILDNAKQSLANIFMTSIDNLNISIVESAAIYMADTYGNHNISLRYDEDVINKSKTSISTKTFRF